MEIRGVFATTAARVAHEITANERHSFFKDLEDGGLHLALRAGAGAINWLNLMPSERIIPIPLGACARSDTGAPLAVFADGGSAVPGIQITNSKARTIRWNDNGTLTPVLTEVVLPPDLQDLSDVTFNALVSKTGATLADAATITVAAYMQSVAALHDADTNFGGATNAMTGDATAKTIAHLQRTLAAADVGAAPASITLLFGPTALTVDDFLIHSAWLSYVPK
jgi:hypothetical protein